MDGAAELAGVSVVSAPDLGGVGRARTPGVQGGWVFAAVTLVGWRMRDERGWCDAGLGWRALQHGADVVTLSQTRVLSQLRNPARATVSVAGVLDRAGVARLRSELAGWRAAGTVQLRVDVSEVSRCCEPDLAQALARVLAWAGAQLRARGGELTVSGANDWLRRELDAAVRTRWRDSIDESPQLNMALAARRGAGNLSTGSPSRRETPR